MDENEMLTIRYIVVALALALSVIYGQLDLKAGIMILVGVFFPTTHLSGVVQNGSQN